MPKQSQPVKRRVRVYLAQRDMTQQDLAIKLRITSGHLSGILAGKETPSLTVAVALQELTGIPVRDFIGKDKIHESVVESR